MISGKIIKINSKSLPQGALVTASEQLIVDGIEIKEKFFIKDKTKISQIKNKNRNNE